ncbi:MAG TPA: alpha/beta hydrolase [Frankiaceae bacterium]|nr:alpha/beta hydrolase [Frankiaceae bacterium]
MPTGPVRSADGATIEIAYETLGDPGGIPLLMVHGLGMQLVGWHPDLLKELTARGYRLAIFDNRDAGQSSHFPHAGSPDIGALLARDASAAAYTLSDLADDTAGLLDLLDWPTAHVMGVSMGGMTVQTLALRHPHRLRSMTTIMATTGAEGVGQPTDVALGTLLAPPALTREDYIDNAVRSFSIIGSTDFPHDYDHIRTRAGQSWDRGHDPDGTIRQVAAILASGDRTAQLGDLRVPTLVVHGTADPLVDVTGGRATAAAIRGAELLEVEGMGHDLPREVWPRFLDRLDDVVARGENTMKATAA